MKLYYYYDKEADVFYLSEGKPSEKDKTSETLNDVVLRVNPKTGDVRGFTIYNFSRRLKDKSKSVPLPIQIKFSPAQIPVQK